MTDLDDLDLRLIAQVEQFYFREARLLDERRFPEWLAMLDPTFQFVMPSRHVPFPDARLRDTPAIVALDAELEMTEPSSSPFREENYQQMAVRVMRAYKVNAWAEVPAARTRRLIANVEVESGEDDTLVARSNFHLFYSRESADNHHYVGCRKDVLKRTNGGMVITRRVVVLDWNAVTAPTLGLFF